MEAKILQLLDDLIEQRLASDSAAELSQLLRTRTEVAEGFLQLLSVHQNLIEAEAPVRPFSLEELRAIKAVEGRFDIEIKSTVSPGGAGLVVGSSEQGPAGNRLKGRLWGLVLATAATMLLALLFASKSANHKELASELRDVASENSYTGDKEVVARIIKKIDCDWEDDRWNVAASTNIIAGQTINLSRGLLILEFTSGAELTLNGPVTLIATSQKSAKLVTGELSARVPVRGRGFTVETHAGDFVDLGTEFGLIVGNNGDVQTHVFEGKVIAETGAVDDKLAKSVVLETGDAWARPAVGDANTLSAEPERFVLPNFAQHDSSAIPPPVERNLTLWFSASGDVQRDHSGNVSAWGDMPTPANGKREDAWQVTASSRPRWQPNAIGGLPTLRFDGYKSLVTEPVHIGVNHTSVVVFRADLEAASRLIRGRTEFQHLGAQLLNLNGPPHTVLQVNDDATLEARVHLGFIRDQPDPVDVGLVRSDLALDSRPHVALYSYDADKSVARLYIDGSLTVTSNNVPYVATTDSPRYLGSHYGRDGFGFTGDIAEVMVFDSALDTQESQDLSVWLGKLYGIPTAPPVTAN